MYLRLQHSFSTHMAHQSTGKFINIYTSNRILLFRHIPFIYIHSDHILRIACTSTSKSCFRLDILYCTHLPQNGEVSRLICRMYYRLIFQAQASMIQSNGEARASRHTAAIVTFFSHLIRSSYHTSWDLRRAGIFLPCHARPPSHSHLLGSPTISCRMTLLTPATLKLVFLLGSGIAHQIITTPPNPPAKKIVKQSFFEKYVHCISWIVKVSKSSSTHCSHLTIWYQYPFWLVLIFDMGTTALLVVGGSTTMLPYPFSILVPNVQALQHPSRTFALSAVLLAASASLRAWCYTALGDQFRVEVSIQPRHKLVTSGPYSFVRHPSYLACYGYDIGSVGLLTSQGTYFRECVLSPFLQAMICAMFPGPEGCEEAVSDVGKFHVAAMITFVVWIGAVFLIGYKLAGRLSWEDDVVHKEFGKEWELYAERVRWRIFPGIL